MRVALISDLHTDINEAYPVAELTVEAAKELSADALIIAGDISETPERTAREMKKMAEMSDFPVFYVPGNHDMWKKNCPGKSTEEIYREYREDPRCLSGKGPVLIRERAPAGPEEAGPAGGAGGLLVLGDIGWYDYSFASESFSRDELDAMTRNGRTWQDKLYNDWTADNPAAMERALEELAAGFARIGERREREEEIPPVLAVTHMLPVKEFLVPENQGDWSYFNAFLGSRRLGKLFSHCGARWAVCGHVHYRMECEKDGVRYICPCLGYYTEWPLYGLPDNEAASHVRDAMYLLKV